MNLFDARKKKKFSQFDMAVKLGITERTWRRWENSESKIPSDILGDLQEVLGLTDAEVLSIIKTPQKEAG